MPAETFAIDDDALIRPFRFVLWAIWGALLLSLGGYAGVGEIVRLSGPAAPVEVGYVLGAVAVACVVAAVVVRGRLLPPTAPPGRPGRVTPEPAPPPPPPRFLAHIVTLALLEACGLLGLVATLLLHDPRFVLAFAAVGGAGMLVFRPSDDRIRGTLQAAVNHP